MEWERCFPVNKRPLDFSNGLVYNLLRKVIGIDFPIALG